ncbi:MAG: SH3 domain-containing protein, partial [Candidatus Latescibacterota bacterium]
MRISVIVFGAFILSLGLCGAYAQTPPKLLSAPDIIPPATEAMQRPEFWISKIGPDAEKVVMTPVQIAALNRSNRSRPLVTKDINGAPYSFADIMSKREFFGIQFYPQDPLTVVPFPGDSLRTGLKQVREYVTRQTWWDRRMLPFPERVKEEIVEAIYENAVPATVRPRYGIMVSRALVRFVPSELKAFGSQYNWLDLFNMEALDTGSAVAVLHASRNGDWYYVRAEYLYGWVRAEQVAFGAASDIRRFSSPEPFLVCLAHKVPVYADNGFTTFMADIYQGVRLPFRKKTDRGYRALLPCRGADGRLCEAEVWLKPDADVSVGYQPFTQKNMINTMFRLLYRPYGWHDSENERDCSGAIMTVLRTFGIFTPHGTTWELHNASRVFAFPKGTPKDFLYRTLDACPPGITLCGQRAHVVM